jgi:cellulose synthase (UDP-forming)
VYHAEALAFGLAPESIEPFIGQRVRWGQGAMHVWRKEGILTHRGLSLAQRLNYLASAATYFDGWQKAIFYFAPVVVLLSGVLPLLASTPEFLLHFVPYYALTFWLFEEVGRGYGRSLFIEQYNMARFAAFAWATLAWLFPRMNFRVTAKGAAATSAIRFTAPQWAVLALNGIAVPLGTLLYLTSHTLPLDGLIANIVWASINAALALAVILFTRISQRNARQRYRFPISLSAQLVTADGTQLPGTVDDLSETGLRFYGRTPSSLAVGDVVSGQLRLPDGPLDFQAQVRSGASPVDSDEGAARTLGCELAIDDEGRRRLERFLFGSDMQWLLNGFTDRVHTPLSRALPRLIDGPAHNPFAEVRWNSAELRIGRDGPAAAVLLSTASAAPAQRFVISHEVLPTQRELVLDVHRRSDTPRRRVQLESMPLPGIGSGCAGLHAYRIVGERADVEPPSRLPGRTAAPPRRVPVARQTEALPSTF